MGHILGSDKKYQGQEEAPMFEIASDRRTRDAYRAAHDERSQYLRALWGRVFGKEG